MKKQWERTLEKPAGKTAAFSLPAAKDV